MRSETPDRAPCPHATAPTEAGVGAVLAVLNEPMHSLPACVHCHGPRVQRWGHSGGVQRFRCKTCARSFNTLTGTPLARLRRRDLWLDYAQALNDGLSIRAAGCRLGIHHNTTFRWRHRWLIQPSQCRDTALHGIVEIATVTFATIRQTEQSWRRVSILPTADERPDDHQQRAPDGRPRIGGTTQTPLDHRIPLPPKAEKPPQIVVLIARDRHGATVDGVLDALDQESVETILAPLLDPDQTVLCTPGHEVFAQVARTRRIAHHPDGASEARNALHRAHVQAYVRRLDRWMRRFLGVSLRYLHHYLGWRRVVDRHTPPAPPLHWLRIALGRHQPPTVAKRQAAAA